jgi:hypothetical protein
LPPRGSGAHALFLVGASEVATVAQDATEALSQRTMAYLKEPSILAASLGSLAPWDDGDDDVNDDDGGTIRLGT